MAFFIVFPVLAIVASLTHLVATSKLHAGVSTAATIFLYYFLIFNVGLQGILGFYGHAFSGNQIAQSIGWAPSPIQYEAAVANLAMGVLGIFCIWFGATFWFATIVADAVWLWGDAIGHMVSGGLAAKRRRTE